MPPILFDTSIYIRDLRTGHPAALSARFLRSGIPVWLSAVVLEELNAGASKSGRRAIQRLGRDFERLRRIVVPGLQDWMLAGEILAEFAARYGYEAIGRGRLTNDALIATSSKRLGITVVTSNARDFERLASIHPFSWQKPSESPI